MTRPRKVGQHFALLTLGALVLASWACGREKLAPSSAPRATGPWMDTLPAVPTSYLDVPVRYDLAPALQWLEATVPRAVGDINDRRPVPGKNRMHYAFHLERQPFRVRIEGRTATVVASIRYQGRAWYDPPVLPEISGSCGVGDTRPRARVAIVSSVELTENWTLKPRTRAVAEPLTRGKRDRCKVTALRIDVSDKVLAAARAALQKELTDFDQRVACFDLQAEAQKVWDVLQSPLRLTDSLWLAIDPSAVRIGLLEVEGDTLVTTVGLSANPRIVGGPRPPPSERPLPAPQHAGTQPPALHLLTEARVPYDVMSVMLTTLYAVGHPAFDTATAELFMPDLAYDIGTRSALVGALSWLAQGTIEDFLRTRVRIKMGHIIEQGRELLERNLNRELVPGVQLRATVGAGRVLGVRAAPDALLARAVASGQGELVLDLMPEGPGPRLGKRPRAAQCP
jgi:hypothetical protein